MKMQILSTKNRAQNEKCMWGTFPPSLLSSFSTIFPYLFPFLFILLNNLPFFFFKIPILPWINLFMKCFLSHAFATSLAPFYDLSTFTCFTWSSFPLEFELTLKVCLSMTEYLHLVHDVPSFKVSQSSTINPQILFPHLMSKSSPNQVPFYQRIMKGQQGNFSWLNLMKRPWPIFSLGLHIGKTLRASSHLVVPELAH